MQSRSAGNARGNAAGNAAGNARQEVTRTARWSIAAIALCLAFSAGAEEGLKRTPSPEGARVYFIGLEDGAVVSSPLEVRFGLVGMGVAPAGVEALKTGHHHLLIDIDVADPSLPVPADANHRHFGGGQTEVSVELTPGTHTLQLLLADHLHVPHDPPVMSEKITVTVE